MWFGTSEPDDSKGALPYDTYIIEELRSDSNKGFELIPPFEIVVSRNNLVIDLGTLTDEYEKEISIHTTATSKDGEKTILAGKEVTIVDTVKLPLTFEFSVLRMSITSVVLSFVFFSV